MAEIVGYLVYTSWLGRITAAKFPTFNPPRTGKYDPPILARIDLDSTAYVLGIDALTRLYPLPIAPSRENDGAGRSAGGNRLPNSGEQPGVAQDRNRD